MRTKIQAAALAALAASAAACHSGGTYFQSAEPLPYGPGVVDCSGYKHTENAYVRDRCMSPGPVALVTMSNPSDARAPQGDVHKGCGDEVESAPYAPDLARIRVSQPPVAVAPQQTSAPRGTSTRLRIDPGTVTPGISTAPSNVAWDTPVPPPRPGAPLPRPRGSRDTMGN